MTDKTLAATEPQSVDVTPDVKAENFDIDAFVNGARHATRAVLIYQRPDLLADIEIAEREVELARKKRQRVSDLEDHLDDLYRALVDSGRWFHVQGRSDAWRSDVEKSVKKAGGSKEDVVLEQLAQSIVVPSNVTADHLRRLQEIDEAQVKKLVAAFSIACVQPTQVTAPFSRARSKGDPA